MFCSLGLCLHSVFGLMWGFYLAYYQWKDWTLHRICFRCSNVNIFICELKPLNQKTSIHFKWITWNKECIYGEESKINFIFCHCIIPMAFVLFHSFKNYSKMWKLLRSSRYISKIFTGTTTLYI